VSHGADFRALFGRNAEVAGDAPGRVNLIGEHTDYNAGYVLPSAIPQRTRVELARRDDDVVRVVTAGVAGDAQRGGDAEDIPGVNVPAEFRLGAESRRGAWIDYVQGCTAALAHAGHAIGGFDAAISSTVPPGAGVSSSAALEVSLLRALRAAFDLALDDVALALLGHDCENRFVGARVGIMDQMAASLCTTTTALLLDTRTLAWECVALPDAAELVVIHSGVTHSHASGTYNARRDECERAARLLGISALRDTGEHAIGAIAKLPAPLDRRARHVVTENARVLATVAAMRNGDSARVGELFRASHASLREDYEVSVAEVDTLVEIACNDADVYGARITGGGFGGSVVILAQRGRAGAAAERIARAYRTATAREPAILMPEREPSERAPESGST
jgi:galactokinase